MDNNKIILGLQEKIAGLQAQITDLSSQVNKNNFSSSQIFNKDVIFSTRIRVPIYSSAPSVAEIGDLICVSAKLYLCTTASAGGVGAVWTLVGSQS